uniref:Sodium Bile acid symporter family n=1 Tax=Steinernema glaseri TaxID=37863 RepID=A0A1I8A3R0_9BILA
MGCELDLNVVFETIKSPVAPSIGFFTQFCLMPTIAYVIAQTIFVPAGLSSFALGLFVTACAPGGGASNFWTLLLGGNAHLSVTMTFLSMIASLVMMPLWMHLLGKQFLEGYNPEATIRVPYAKIVTSLLALVIPLLIGVAIQKWKPELAAKARKVMRPYVVIVLVFLIVFGSLANSYMFYLMSVPALVGGLLLPWCGFMFGCFTSIVLRQPPANVTAIAIETGIQNTGIAIMLLKFSFPEPDADISALIPVIVASFTPAPLLLGMLVHRIIKAMRKGNEDSANDQELGMNKESSPLEVVHSSSSSLSTRKSYLPKTDSDSTISIRPILKDYTDCPLLKGAPPNLTVEEQVNIVSEILSDVLTPGVVPR